MNNNFKSSKIDYKLGKNNVKAKLRKEAQVKAKQNRKADLMIPHIANLIGQTASMIEQKLPR